MILLDTHALIWWASEDRKLSQRAKNSIDAERETSGTVAVSSISAWEIAMLVERDRLTLAMDVSSWLETVSSVSSIKFFPVDNTVAVLSARLPDSFHKDPADRIIVATALTLNVPLLTADARIRAYPHVDTVW